tara:strand:- start:752 stop:1642 length:891 start_codon:yes stop_codon:yes gene_type:complete
MRDKDIDFLKKYVKKHKDMNDIAKADFNFNSSLHNAVECYGTYILPPQIQTRIAIDLGSNAGLFSHQFFEIFDTIYAIDASYQNFVQSLKASKMLPTNNVFCFNLAAAKETGRIIKVYRNDINGTAVSPVTEKKMIQEPMKRVFEKNQGWCHKEALKILSLDKSDKFKKVDDSDYLLAIEDVHYEIPWSEKCESFHNVFTISIDGIYDFFNIDYIDFLKIDIEGAEYDFLLDKDLSRIGSIAIEMHGTLGEKLKDKLKSHLLKFFDIMIVHRDDISPGHSEILYVSKELNKNFMQG